MLSSLSIIITCKKKIFDIDTNLGKTLIWQTF